jgi:serine/threonine-protein kinase
LLSWETDASARPFLQRRVTTYLCVALTLWSFAFGIDRVLRGFWSDVPDSGGASDWYFYAYYGALALLLALYLVARFGACPVPVLRAIEVFVTFLQGVLSSIVLGQLPLSARPEIMAVLSATLFLLVRAGLVPGSGISAFFVGALTMLPANVLAYWLYTTHAAVPGSDLNPTLGVLYCVYWSVLALVATTSIHAVIYGLRERVEELGQYTLLHKIGEGGMGVVYRAKHALLRRATAVKLLPIDRMDQNRLARFEREVQLTAAISHPNIVAVYDFGRTPSGSFYYAMEFLDGIDLQRLVEESGPLPLARAVHLLTQAADALAQAHEFQLIHRDVKPANLFVSNSPRRPDHLTVLDFGLAKTISNRDPYSSDEDTLSGTPLYMAPESILDPAQTDERSDVYALGAVAYWLVTGTTPFRGRTVVEVCAAHLHEIPEPPSRRLGASLPADFEELTLACLAKDKADRPHGAAVLLERLRALDAGVWTEADAQHWWHTRAEQARFERAPAREPARTLTIADRGRDRISLASGHGGAR